jgi:hypothetical protein
LLLRDRYYDVAVTRMTLVAVVVVMGRIKFLLPLVTYYIVSVVACYIEDVPAGKRDDFFVVSIPAPPLLKVGRVDAGVVASVALCL